MSLQAGFRELSGALAEWRKTGLNEAQTTTAIVLRVLHLLGYNLWDPFEVVPQESGNGGVPDFIVKVENRSRFVIEVKKLGSKPDDKAKTQAVSYANNQAIRWAILTDGDTWQFFDSFMRRPAHERLILTLSFTTTDADLLAQYFSRLLEREHWLKGDPDASLQQEAADIHSHIRLSSELQPLARELGTFAREYNFQDPESALKLIEDKQMWSAEKLSLVQKNSELFGQLAGFKGTSQPQAATPSSAAPSPLDVIDVLRRGIAMSAPPKRAAKSSGLRAWLNGEPCEAMSWRDLHAGAAEALLLLGQEDVLRSNDFVYDTPTERKKESGQPYPISAYRRLSNGKYLYLHASAEGHKSRALHLFRLLGVPEMSLKVSYKGSTFQLPKR